MSTPIVSTPGKGDVDDAANADAIAALAARVAALESRGDPLQALIDAEAKLVASEKRSNSDVGSPVKGGGGELTEEQDPQAERFTDDIVLLNAKRTYDAYQQLDLEEARERAHKLAGFHVIEMQILANMAETARRGAAIAQSIDDRNSVAANLQQSQINATQTVPKA